MKAIIMAGGEGSRLRPLTCDCPKPMMRLINRPVMQYAIELLAQHGISEIAATLGYQPDAITDYFGDGTDFDVHLEYFIEKTPLGTAGGVRQAKTFLDETFIVLSGDGITDLDITAALNFHRQKQAQATIVLRRAVDPSEYGVVSIDHESRIVAFHEKPGRSDVLSDLINTGIYILEPTLLDRIPTDGSYDFGHDLFPRLVDEGVPIFGYETDRYWCDIGDVGAYIAAHMAAMNGGIGLPSLPDHALKIIHSEAFVDPSAHIDAPCLIAPGAHIGSGAHVGAYSVVGENCRIGAHADLKRCILWNGVRVGAYAQLRGCVLAEHSVIEESAQVFEECILGTAATVGERATLLPGVRLWPGKSTADGERVDSNLVWGNRRIESFVGGALPLSSPSQAARAAQACAAALQPREILLGRAASTVADAMWHAAASGIMAQGGQVIDAGECTLAQLRHAQTAMVADCAVWITAEQMIPLGKNGARLSPKLQRLINTMYARQDYSGPFSGITRPILSGVHSEIAYIADTAACFAADAKFAPNLSISAQSPLLLSRAERIFTRAGLNIRTGWEDEMLELAPGEIGIGLDERGERAVLSDENGALSEAEQQLMLAWIALENGERTLTLPVSATRAIESLALEYGAQAEYLCGEEAVWMEVLAEAHPQQFALWFDGIRAALSAISLLTANHLTLKTWRQAMPGVHRRSRRVEIPLSETGRVLNAFAEEENDIELGGGLRFRRENGWGWICPDERRAQFRIVTESVNAEFARELCDFCEKKLAQLAKKSSTSRN